MIESVVHSQEVGVDYSNDTNNNFPVAVDSIESASDNNATIYETSSNINQTNVDDMNQQQPFPEENADAFELCNKTFPISRGKRKAAVMKLEKSIINI